MLGTSSGQHYFFPEMSGLEGGGHSQYFYPEMSGLGVLSVAQKPEYRKKIYAAVKFALRNTPTTQAQISGISEAYYSKTIDLMNYVPAQQNIEDDPMFKTMIEQWKASQGGSSGILSSKTFLYLAIAAGAYYFFLRKK